MAKKKERKKTYKFIEKLIDKVTTSKSNNTEFVCYGHLVELLSGTEDYVSVTYTIPMTATGEEWRTSISTTSPKNSILSAPRARH